jgi:hypothetical protein
MRARKRKTLYSASKALKLPRTGIVVARSLIRKYRVIFRIARTKIPEYLAELAKRLG